MPGMPELYDDIVKQSIASTEYFKQMHKILEAIRAEKEIPGMNGMQVGISRTTQDKAWYQRWVAAQHSGDRYSEGGRWYGMFKFTTLRKAKRSYRKRVLAREVVEYMVTEHRARRKTDADRALEVLETQG